MCIDRETQEILALKSLKKNVILIKEEVPGVITENRVLQRINHPFLTVCLGPLVIFNYCCSFSNCCVVVVTQVLLSDQRLYMLCDRVCERR